MDSYCTIIPPSAQLMERDPTSTIQAQLELELQDHINLGMVYDIQLINRNIGVNKIGNDWDFFILLTLFQHRLDSSALTFAKQIPPSFLDAKTVLTIMQVLKI